MSGPQKKRKASSSDRYHSNRLAGLFSGTGGNHDLKRTVSVILGDPPCKDGNARFTKLPLQPLSDHVCGRYCYSSRLLSVYF